MKIPAEYFDEFFDPLVGGDEAVTKFRNDLIGHVRATPIDGLGEVDDLYDALRSKTNDIVVATVNSTLGSKPESHSPLEIQRRNSIARNGELGVQFAVEAMRSLGRMYERFAETPQREEKVVSNARRILGNVIAIAFDDGIIGHLNFEAYNMGLDPHKMINRPALIFGLLVNRKMRTSFDKAYSVTDDVYDGQLSFQPRFRKLGKIFDEQCPAVRLPLNWTHRLF